MVWLFILKFLPISQLFMIYLDLCAACELGPLLVSKFTKWIFFYLSDTGTIKSWTFQVLSAHSKKYEKVSRLNLMVRTDYTENNGSKDVACCIQKFTMRLQVLYKIKIETEKKHIHWQCQCISAISNILRNIGEIVMSWSMTLTADRTIIIQLNR